MSTKNKFIDPILREVAEEFNLPYYVVQEIYESPFKFIKLKNKEFNSWKIYLLNGLGKFRPIEPIRAKLAKGEPINNVVRKVRNESKEE